jgi:hypothetical protein
MTNVLPIFRKDVRHLWPHAAASVILMALAAILDPTYASRGQSTAYSLLAGFALPLACWSLIIAAIHEEKLPGDRQYWLTRPYSWKDLLAAKALFVVAFINLPLFAWHTAAFAAVGIPLGEHLPALLWRQVFFSAFYILPVAALAAITRSLGQVILTALLGLLPVAFLDMFLFARLQINWVGMESLMTAAIAATLSVGVVVILVLQYSGRATRLSRVVAGALAVTVLLVVFAGSRLSGGRRAHLGFSSIQISLDTQSGRHSSVAASGSPDVVRVDIPVRMDGVPVGVDLIQNQMTVWLEGSGNRIWRPADRPDGGFHDVTEGTAWLTLFVDRNAFEWLGPHHATVRGTAGFIAFGRKQILPLPKGQSVVMPRVGVCTDTRDQRGFISLVCYTPNPRASVTIGTTRNRLNWIIPQGLVETSIPTSSGFQPLERFTSLVSYRNWEDIGVSQLMTAEPLPPVGIAFELPGIDLAEYVLWDRPPGLSHKPLTEH